MKVVKAHIKPRTILYGVLLVIFVLGMIVSLQSRQIDADTIANDESRSIFDQYGISSRPAAVSLCAPGDTSCQPYVVEDGLRGVGDLLNFSDPLARAVQILIEDCISYYGNFESSQYPSHCSFSKDEVTNKVTLVVKEVASPGNFAVIYNFKEFDVELIASGDSNVDISGDVTAMVELTPVLVENCLQTTCWDKYTYNKDAILFSGGYKAVIKQSFSGKNDMSYMLEEAYPDMIIDNEKSRHTLEFQANLNAAYDVEYHGDKRSTRYFVTLCKEKCTFWNKTQAIISAKPKDNQHGESYETNISHEEKYSGTGVLDDNYDLQWSHDVQVDKEDRRSWNMQYDDDNYIGSTSSDAHIEPFNDVSLIRSSFIQTLNFSSPTFHPGEESMINLWTHRVVENDNGVTTISGEGRIDDPLGATTGVFTNESGFDKMQITGSTVPNYQLTHNPIYDISKDSAVNTSIANFSAPLGSLGMDSTIIPDYFTALQTTGLKTVLSTPSFKALPSNVVILWNHSKSETAGSRSLARERVEMFVEELQERNVEVQWSDNYNKEDYINALKKAKNGSLVLSMGHGAPGFLLIGKKDSITYEEIRSVVESNGIKLAMFAAGSCYAGHGSQIMSSVAEQFLGSVGLGYSDIDGAQQELAGVSHMFGMGSNNFSYSSNELIGILEKALENVDDSSCDSSDTPDQPTDPDQSDDVVPDLTPPDLIPPIDLTSDTPDELSEPTVSTEETQEVTEPTEEVPVPTGILDAIGDILESIAETIGDIINPDPTEVEVYEEPTPTSSEPAIEVVTEVVATTPTPILIPVTYTPPVIERVATVVTQAIAYARNDPTPPQSAETVTQTSPAITDAQAVVQNIEEPVRDPADIKTLTWIDKVAVAQNTLADANHQLAQTKANDPKNRTLIRLLTRQVTTAKRTLTLNQRKLKLVQSLSVRYKVAVVKVDTTAAYVAQTQENLNQSNTRRNKSLLRTASARHRTAIRNLVYVQRQLNRY